MALVSFGYRVDMNTIAPPTDPAGYIVAYDLDGILKQKNHLGVISLVGSGTSGSSGTSGVDGIVGGQLFYFNESVVGFTASYKHLGNSPVISSEEIVTKTLGPTESNVLMSSYISDSLGLNVIPGGVQRFNLHYKKGASQSNISTYAVVQLANQNGDKYYDLGATQAIAYSNTQEIGWENDNVVNISLDIISITTEIQATDRIVISLYTNNLDTTTQSVSFYTEGLNNYSYVQTSTAVVPGPRGATGFGVTSSFYLQGTTDYSYDTTSDIYRTGSLNIGTGTASDTRFLVSSSGGTVSLLVNEQGDTIFSGDTKISGQTFSNLPPGSITFGSKTAIYSPNDAEIVIGTDRLATYSYNYGWKFNRFQITNLWGNPIEVQNTIGTIGNLWIGSNYVFAGYGVPVSQQSTLFVKGTTSSIMKVVGTGATSSNSDSIFEINDSGVVSIDGNVGIGTTSPSTKLHVYGTQSGVFRLEDGTQGDGYVLTSDANGVGSWKTPTYKVFTALLTQSGGDSPDSINGQDNFNKGETYEIVANPNNEDLTPYGAPNNNVGTYFICNANVPAYTFTYNLQLGYNSGAPVATVLENTIGNIWFRYNDYGYYNVFSNLLFIENKTTIFFGPSNNDESTDSAITIDYYSFNNEQFGFRTYRDGGLVDSQLYNTPIEIRVYE